MPPFAMRAQADGRDMRGETSDERVRRRDATAVGLILFILVFTTRTALAVCRPALFLALTGRPQRKFRAAIVTRSAAV